MIELPTWIVPLGSAALVWLGFQYTKNAFVVNWLAGSLSLEEERTFQFTQMLDNLADSQEIMSRAMEQEQFDKILDIEGMDAYQLLARMSEDLKVLSEACRAVTGTAMVEIDYED